MEYLITSVLNFAFVAHLPSEEVNGPLTAYRINLTKSVMSALSFLQEAPLEPSALAFSELDQP